MKATIFFLDSQANLAHKLKALLPTTVYPSIETILCNAEQITCEELATQYFKLLQAAAEPDSLRFSVRRHDYAAYRLYIEVYHYFFGGRSVDPKVCFPALAIEGRMVLVPKGLGSRQGEKSLFRLLEADGLMEVECTNEYALKGALAAIGEHLKTEITRNLAVAASYLQPGAEIDISSLAAQAGVDAGYVRYSFRAEALERLFYRHVKCDLQPRVLQSDRWTKVRVSIHNRWDRELRDASIFIEGPVSVSPNPIVVSVRPDGFVRIPVGVKPKDTGEFPVEIQVVLPGDRMLREWLPAQHVWLQCHDLATSAAGPDVVDAQDANLESYEDSGEALLWVQAHPNGWSHDDWLSLLRDLQAKGYWPINTQKLGELLERIRGR